jgi:methionyl-tRNA formyltransferase
VRTVFLGTPQFAVPTLESMLEAGHEVAAVYTQPDRPKGRGQEMAASAVKECALRHGLDVRQPEKIRRPEVVDELRVLDAEVYVVVGYGQIIPQAIIDLPKRGILNVHASLLPKYRGAAPIQWAIANGEAKTGVTIMQIEAGLDTGPMLAQAEMEIGPEETSLDLAPKLARLGADLLVRTLAEWPESVRQWDAEATLAPIMKREDGLIDWNQPARAIHCRSRGFLPWPGAWTWFRKQRFSIWRCQVANVEQPAVGGKLFSSQRHLYATCGGGTTLELLEVQTEGRKRVSGADFLNGVRLADNELLGEAPQ